MPHDLPIDYYLDNFRQLLDFVAERYWLVLNDREQKFYRDLSTAERPAQMLYVRLLSRRSDCFLLRKLAYPEIGDIGIAANLLANIQLLELDPGLDLGQTCDLLNKADICQRLDLRRHQSRAALLQQLANDARGHAAIIQKLLTGETVYRLRDSELFDTFKLCFFGNLRQDLTDFVLRDIGLFRYEDYHLEQQQLLFAQRSQLDQHLQYYRSSEQLDAVLQSDTQTIVALWQELPAMDPNDPLLSRRLQRLGNTLARQLERLGATEQALAIYRQLQRPPARERCARILAANSDIPGALQCCEAMIAAPVNEEERYFAAEFGYRQARKAGIDWPQPERYQATTEHLSLAPADTRVELAVAKHLATEGDCHYVENSLLNGVLGLVIWDVIFAPVRGAFFNPFQSAPIDFYDPGFVNRRRQLLQQQLDKIGTTADMTRLVLGRFEDKYGISNPLVDWSNLSRVLLHKALERIPVCHWQVMMQRLLADLRQHRSGMPDLVYFPAAGGYEWIEVKGPGDRLQKNQQRWLAFFATQAIPHRVLHINWLAS